MRAIFELLSGTTIAGINQSEPLPYDLAAIQAQIEQHQLVIDQASRRTPRRVTVSGVDNGNVIVPFADVGTTNYWVDAAWITPSGGINDVNWSVVSGSKLSNQVTLRSDGLAGGYLLEVTITPVEGI